MFKKLKILDESDKRLRTISKDVTFPLSDEEKQIVKDAMENLRFSQIEKYAKKFKNKTIPITTIIWEFFNVSIKS